MKDINVKRQEWGIWLTLFDAHIGDLPWRSVSGHVNHAKEVRAVLIAGYVHSVADARDYARAILSICEAVEVEPMVKIEAGAAVASEIDGDTDEPLVAAAPPAIAGNTQKGEIVR